MEAVMKNGFFLLLSFFIILSSPLWAVKTTSEKMVYFTSSKRSDSFSILVPQSWSMSASFDSEIPSYFFTKDNALIAVKVQSVVNLNLSDMIRGEYISLLDKDPSCSQILDTDEYLTAKSIKVRLVVFEYTDSKTRKAIVQRSYFINTENRVFIITCSAPRSVFYKFEDIFTASMGSFKTGIPSPQPAAKPAPKKVIPKEQPVEPEFESEKEPEPEKETEIEKEPEEKVEPLPQEEPVNKEVEPKQDEEQKTEQESKVEEQTPEVKEETPKEPQTPEEKEAYEPKPDENTTPKKGDEPPPYTNSSTIP
jgi:hypothetical protein